MAEQKLLLGNIRGSQGAAGPNTVSSSTTTSGFENGHVLFNNNGKVGAKSLLDLVYPVGSIFEWSNNGISGAPDLSTVAKVQAHFGGTWEEYGKGRVLAGMDSSQTEFATAGKTGGEKTHTLTVNELPAISGSFACSTPQSHGEYAFGVFSGESFGQSTKAPPAASGQSGNIYGYALSFGGRQAHNNLQPYITVYRYRRTA